MTREDRFIRNLIDRIDQEIIKAYASYAYESKITKEESFPFGEFKKKAITEIIWTLNKEREEK